MNKKGRYLEAFTFLTCLFILFVSSSSAPFEFDVNEKLIKTHDSTQGIAAGEYDVFVAVEQPSIPGVIIGRVALNNDMTVQTDAANNQVNFFNFVDIQIILNFTDNVSDQRVGRISSIRVTDSPPTPRPQTEKEKQ